MTNEKREAIEYLKESVLIYKNTIPKISQSIDTVLSLIKEQEKQIDLMTEIFYKKFKAELLLEYGFENEDQLKQYFEGLVEKE